MTGENAAGSFVLGVDVGTGSVRAGLFDRDGNRRAFASSPIALWRPQPDWAEQSSTDIWRAVCEVSADALWQSGIAPRQVSGVGFDATCSLVVLGRSDEPVAVSPGAEPERNVIVWMDHRAVAEAEEINTGRYEVLQYVGGEISPEMEIPKLLWLRRHMPGAYESAGRFMDLADFLARRATGTSIRSECTTACKWTYLAHEHRWDEAFLRSIGLEGLPDDRCGRSGDIRPLGSLAGRLTDTAAAEMSLAAGTPVAVGAIDAHAGGIGLLGAANGSGSESGQLDSSLALIGGTSSCHMAVSTDPRFIPGVWGPYFGAMVPGMWLTEGGQSAAGSLIDFVIDSHPASSEMEESARSQNCSRYDVLNRLVADLAAERGVPFPAALTRDYHLLDYHLGNRSPHADPRARGVLDGAGFDVSIAALAVAYLAAVQAVAYGTRKIVETLNRGGYAIDRILATGGATKNPIWLREHADATGLELRMGREPESVVLGAAILGAVAGGLFADIPAAMSAMTHTGQAVLPDPRVKQYHDAKYECYNALYQCHLDNRRRMTDF